jgi:hypothetical protein
MCAAAEGGFLKMVAVLVKELGADVNQACEEAPAGDTALISLQPRTAGFLEMVQLLMTDHLGARTSTKETSEITRP